MIERLVMGGLIGFMTQMFTLHYNEEIKARMPSLPRRTDLMSQPGPSAAHHLSASAALTALCWPTAQAVSVATPPVTQM